jgi:hypothetical protein
MKHLNLKLEALEERIAPGGLKFCGPKYGCGSKGSKGSKSKKSKKSKRSKKYKC